MTQHHQHQTPTRLYRILSILLPLGIYGCQLFGKFTLVGTCAAGVLTALKAWVEWKQHSSKRVVQRTSPQPQSLLVPLRAPVAGCYLCHEMHQLRPYQITTGHQVGICQQCYRWSTFTHHYA